MHMCMHMHMCMCICILRCGVYGAAHLDQELEL